MLKLTNNGIMSEVLRAMKAWNLCGATEPLTWISQNKSAAYTHFVSWNLSEGVWE